jgi:hypothetical protein
MEIYNLTIDTCCIKSQDSSVSVAMGYGLGHRDFNSSRDKRFVFNISSGNSLCGLVVRVLGYRSRGPGSIPGTTRFSDK